ncbi:hypothetical protein HZA96_01685 [Candidatus Woesearchaeota archaeon]|nr:hypothetical protein [Candidatus Woesearchaeota archaeon]
MVGEKQSEEKKQKIYSSIYPLFLTYLSKNQDHLDKESREALKRDSFLMLSPDEYRPIFFEQYGKYNRKEQYQRIAATAMITAESPVMKSKTGNELQFYAVNRFTLPGQASAYEGLLLPARNREVTFDYHKNFFDKRAYEAACYLPKEGYPGFEVSRLELLCLNNQDGQMLLRHIMDHGAKTAFRRLKAIAAYVSPDTKNKDQPEVFLWNIAVCNNFSGEWKFDASGNQQSFNYEWCIQSAVSATQPQLRILEKLLAGWKEIINSSGKNYPITQQEVVKDLFTLFKGKKIEIR